MYYKKKEVNNLEGITKGELDFEYLDIDIDEIRKKKDDIEQKKKLLLNGDTLEIDLGEISNYE